MIPTAWIVARWESSDPRDIYRVYFLVALAIAVVISIVQSMRPFGWKKWPLAEAIVMDNPIRTDILAYHSVKIVYSYQFDGRRYTGNYRGYVGRWDDEFLKRFPEGRTLVVRVRPDKPEISAMRDEDQPDGIRQRLERASDERKRKATQT